MYLLRRHKSHDERDPKRHDREYTRYHKRPPNSRSEDNNRGWSSYRRTRENWRENDTHRNGDHRRLEIPREGEERKWAGHDRDNRKETRGRWPNRADAETRSISDNHNENEQYVHRRHGNRGGRGSYRGSRNSRTEETVRPIAVNPMEVPKGGKYFTVKKL